MNSYVSEYREKCVSADEAMKAVQSGDWIEYSWAGSQACLLEEALSKRAEELHDVNFRGAVLLKPMACFEADPTGEHFAWNSWHVGTGLERSLFAQGCGYFLPMKYSEVPRYVRENQRTDVVAIQVSPMDQNGWFTFGVTVSHYAAACERARTIILEVNEDMPRVHGGYDHLVHISQADYIVEGGHLGLPVLPSAAPSETDKKIAGFVLSEISDGACVQLGIGGMPNVLGKMIAESDLKDVGIHTEMLVDSMLDMVESGVVTNMRKTLDRGRCSWSFAAGSQRLYDWMDDNPSLAAYPVDYTNSAKYCSANDNVVSINGALEVDLMGQVCSESVGTRHFSGAGGQLDFVLAAYGSKGGKTFICMPSTYTDKQGVMHSRIKPTLTLGAVVTDTRSTLQYLATDQGIVNFKGMATWQRAEALVSLAHPDFRDELIEAAEELGVWRRKASL
jgi:butyryl-CoA:acetate CoA-transferase